MKKKKKEPAAEERNWTEQEEIPLLIRFYFSRMPKYYELGCNSILEGDGIFKKQFVCRNPIKLGSSKWHEKLHRG